ncbi:hypothetical protein KGI01_20110 [Kurthia gibsonii]|nr:hypothetical protein KGI01_20110 [Kurthia gibsonii]
MAKISRMTPDNAIIPNKNNAITVRNIINGSLLSISLTNIPSSVMRKRYAMTLVRVKKIASFL